MTTRHEAGQGTLLHAYCHRCERWRVLEADVFAVDFVVNEASPPVATCPHCGEQGLVRARVPESQAAQPMLLALEDMPDERWRIYC